MRSSTAELSERAAWAILTGLALRRPLLGPGVAGINMAAKESMKLERLIVMMSKSSMSESISGEGKDSVDGPSMT